MSGLTGSSSFYGFDQSGNTRLLTDAAASVTDTYTYSAFGTEVAATGTTPNPHRFGGEVGYYEDAPARQYVRARYLDTGTGRWISEDPIGILGGTTDLYVYVRNNALKYLDALGLRGVDLLEDLRLGAYEASEDFQLGAQEAGEAIAGSASTAVGATEEVATGLEVAIEVSVATTVAIMGAGLLVLQQPLSDRDQIRKNAPHGGHHPTSQAQKQNRRRLRFRLALGLRDGGYLAAFALQKKVIYCDDRGVFGGATFPLQNKAQIELAMVAATLIYFRLDNTSRGPDARFNEDAAMAYGRKYGQVGPVGNNWTSWEYWYLTQHPELKRKTKYFGNGSIVVVKVNSKHVRTAPVLLPLSKLPSYSSWLFSLR